MNSESTAKLQVHSMETAQHPHAANARVDVPGARKKYKLNTTEQHVCKEHQRHQRIPEPHLSTMRRTVLPEMAVRLGARPAEIEPGSLSQILRGGLSTGSLSQRQRNGPKDYALPLKIHKSDTA